MKRQLITSFLTAVVLLYLVQTPEAAIGVYLGRGFFAVILVIAAITLALRLYRRYKRKIIASTFPLVLTPAVAVVISMYGMFMLNKIDDKAKKDLWAAAVTVEKTCQDKGSVPSSIDGWEKNGDRYSRSVKVDETAYTFFYLPLTESKEFIIGINYGPDARFELAGGVNKTLTQHKRKP